MVTGGKRRGNQGYFFEPTVITGLPDDARLMTEEPFGPIAPITTFKTFDEVVARANSLQFGLAAYVSTVSPSRHPRRRSAASRIRATATKAASKGSRPTRPRSSSRRREKRAS